MPKYLVSTHKRTYPPVHKPLIAYSETIAEGRYPDEAGLAAGMDRWAIDPLDARRFTWAPPIETEWVIREIKEDPPFTYRVVTQNYAPDGSKTVRTSKLVSTQARSKWLAARAAGMPEEALPVNSQATVTGPYTLTHPDGSRTEWECEPVKANLDPKGLPQLPPGRAYYTVRVTEFTQTDGQPRKRVSTAGRVVEASYRNPRAAAIAAGMPETGERNLNPLRFVSPPVSDSGTRTWTQYWVKPLRATR